MSAKHTLDLLFPSAEHTLTSDDADLLILELDRPTITVSGVSFVCSTGRCCMPPVGAVQAA
ncbi:hypothetical protein [Lentzea flava]|uniref:FxLD family lantipeptide n=1 Tax=Lentzea flava TaxID=103732 RepID=A0ABQ2V7G7_9PSEU|nr:hypothetical protein [Lentzea flava]MCP2203877.1 hypothetical protein [Lentzea flava]GGU72446.1 hypothetical protein GCM10010178_75100 [Lentzea flava]